MALSIINDLNEKKPITELIDKYVVDNNNKRKAEHAPGKLYPSSVHKCSRLLCYELLGLLDVQFEPRILKIMDNGNFVHERYQGIFKKIGILICEEAPIKAEELRISGRMDAIIQVDNRFAIAELKSCAENPFNKMKDSGKPDPKYVAQTQLYLHLSGTDLGVIYIENKNNQEVLEFWVEYDKDYCEMLFKKLKTVLQYVDAEKIMPRSLAESLDLFMVDKKKMYKETYVKTCYYCRYCDCKEMCYSEE